MEEQVDYTTKAKTIFRVVKNKDNPFVMIDRRPLENPELSWKAKGLLGYLLSRPDNWTVQFNDLVARSTDGKHATRMALNELIESGHIKRVTERDAETSQFSKTVYEVYENPLPKNQEVDGPLTDFPDAGFPNAENRTLNNTDLNEKEVNDKEHARPKPGERVSPPLPVKKGDIVGAVLFLDHQARTKKAIDLASYPPDVTQVLERFCVLWNLIPPVKPRKGNGGEYAFWIKGARSLLASLGEVGLDALHKAHDIWQKKPFTVSHPGAIVKTAGYAAGLIRGEQAGSDDGYDYEALRKYADQVFGVTQ